MDRRHQPRRACLNPAKSLGVDGSRAAATPPPGPMKYKVDPKKFATFLTSCGRFDLLGETVASFQRYFDVDRILISEDSENTAAAAQFMRDFPVAEVRVNLPKLGQMRSIDAHYATLDCAVRAASGGRLGLHAQPRPRSRHRVARGAPRHRRGVHRASHLRPALPEGRQAASGTAASTISSGIPTRIPSGSPIRSIRRSRACRCGARSGRSPSSSPRKT